MLSRCVNLQDPAPAVALNTLGLMSRDIGDFEKALEYFELAIARITSSHQFYHTIVENVNDMRNRVARK